MWNVSVGWFTYKEREEENPDHPTCVHKEDFGDILWFIVLSNRCCSLGGEVETTKVSVPHLNVFGKEITNLNNFKRTPS